MSWSYRWWDEARTIQVCDVRDTWSWDEAYDIVQEQVSRLSTVDHDVHKIFWLHGSPVMPQDGTELLDLHKLMSMRPSNSQMVVFIGINRFGETLAAMMNKVFGMHDQLALYRFVASIEEALDEIAHYEKERA